jgi:hypothetical protein
MEMFSPARNGHIVEAFRLGNHGQVRVGDENHFHMGNLGSQLSLRRC